MRVGVAQSPSEVGALERHWDRLAAAVGASPFQRYDWATSWLELFGHRFTPAVVWCSSGGEIVAIIPLAADHDGSARFIGTGPSDFLDWLVPERDRQYILARALAALLSVGICHLDLTDVPPASSLIRELQSNQDTVRHLQILPHELCPSVSLCTGWGDYVAGRPRRLRAGMRRSSRKIGELADVRLRVCRSDREVAEGLLTLVGLHLAWFRHRGRTSTLSNADARHFLSLAIPRLFQIGAVRLTMLMCGPDPVSAMITLQDRTRRYYYLSGLDPSHRSLGLGLHHMAAEIRAAFEAGYDRFELLRGGEPYKTGWANTAFRTLRCRLELCA